jgi:hypothetical protein
MVVGARRRRGTTTFPCAEPHRDGAGSKRWGRGSLPWLAQGDRGAWTAGHRQREAAAERVRREGPRGAEVRGGERRERCGEEEMGVPFIGVGRRWWGGETVGQATVVHYQEESGYGRGSDGTTSIHGGIEEESMTCQFESLEGGAGTQCGGGDRNRYLQRRPCCGRRKTTLSGPAGPQGHVGPGEKEGAMG